MTDCVATILRCGVDITKFSDLELAVPIGLHGCNKPTHELLQSHEIRPIALRNVNAL
jgi:hypothetical protein